MFDLAEVRLIRRTLLHDLLYTDNVELIKHSVISRKTSIMRAAT